MELSTTLTFMPSIVSKKDDNLNDGNNEETIALKLISVAGCVDDGGLLFFPLSLGVRRSCFVLVLLRVELKEWVLFAKNMVTIAKVSICNVRRIAFRRHSHTSTFLF